MAAKEMAVYVCEGTCGAIVSERRYRQGLTSCGAEGCTLHGHQFKRKKVID